MKEYNSSKNGGVSVTFKLIADPENELISIDDHRNKTTFIFLPHLQFESHLNAPVYPLFQVAISAGVTKEFLLFFLLWTLRRVFSFNDFWTGEIHLGEFLEMRVALVPLKRKKNDSNLAKLWMKSLRSPRFARPFGVPNTSLSVEIHPQRVRTPGKSSSGN